MELEVKKLEHDIQAAHKDKAGSQAHITALEKQHPWIQDEKKYVILTYPYDQTLISAIDNLGRQEGCTTTILSISVMQRKRPKNLKSYKRGKRRRLTPKCST